MEDIYRKLTEIFCDVFDDDAIVVTPELTAHDVAEVGQPQSHPAHPDGAEGLRRPVFSGADCRPEECRRPGRPYPIQNCAGMSKDLYTGLAWLRPAPDGFAAACKALPGETSPGVAIQALANHALDETQLARLGRAIMREERSLTPLAPFRLGVIGNGTLDLLVPALVASAARHGLKLECIPADYGVTTQEALDAGGRINAARPDTRCCWRLIIADCRCNFLWARQRPSRRKSPARWRTSTPYAMACPLAHAGALRSASSRPWRRRPNPCSTGSFDRVVPGTPRRVIAAINLAIADSIAGTQDALLDVAALAETVGLDRWHSPAQWNLAKLAFADTCLPIYADHVGRLLAALRGRSRKCLILDLDNTLWGGVIGDDGLEGIRIAQGDATGEAHLSVQQMALALRCRGIVLAVSSKNTDDIARRPFREHPEMLLKEDHFAVFQANWNDKATNTKAIAAELSLGLDAMVFLDDNPAERDLVRRMLPQVADP